MLGTLVLLLPGFAAVLGIRIGEQHELLSPRPHKPNSTVTIFGIAFLSLAAHAAGAGLFAVNEVLAHHWTLVQLEYDPNFYRALLTGHFPARLSGAGLSFWLFYVMMLTIGMGALCERLAQVRGLVSATYGPRFGWLLPIAQKVEAGEHVAIGYVLTNSSYNGASMAYEGIIRKLTLNDDDAIEMIALEQCDRFLVKIADDEIKRIDTEGAATIALMQFRAAQIVNVAIELLEIQQSDDLPEAAAS